MSSFAARDDDLAPLPAATTQGRQDRVEHGPPARVHVVEHGQEPLAPQLVLQKLKPQLLLVGDVVDGVWIRRAGGGEERA